MTHNLWSIIRGSWFMVGRGVGRGLAIVGIKNGVMRRRTALGRLLGSFTTVRKRGILIRKNKHSTAGVTTRLNVSDGVIGNHHVASTRALGIIAVICNKLIGGGVMTKLRTHNIGTLKLAKTSVGMVHSVGHPIGRISCNFMKSMRHISSALLSSLVRGNIIPIVTPLARSKRKGVLGAGTSAVTKRATGTLSTVFSIALICYFRGGNILHSRGSSRDIVPRVGRTRFRHCVTRKIVRKKVVPGLRGSFRTVGTNISRIMVALTSTVRASKKAQVGGWFGGGEDASMAFRRLVHRLGESTEGRLPEQRVTVRKWALSFNAPGRFQRNQDEKYYSKCSS